MEFFGGRTAGGRDIEKAEGYTIDLNGADLGGVILQAGWVWVWYGKRKLLK